MKYKLNRSLVIVLEGGEGTGKSTMINKLVDYYTVKGYDTISFREPGNTELAEKIRDLLLNYEMDNATELLLYSAARSSNCMENIVPAVEDRKLIFLDRFIESTYVYQGIVNGNKISDVECAISVSIPNEILKDAEGLNILLDCPIDVTKERIKDRGTHNKYDDKSDTYLEKIRQAYIYQFNCGINSHLNYQIVDASDDENTVFLKCIQIIDAFLEDKYEEELTEEDIEITSNSVEETTDGNEEVEN